MEKLIGRTRLVLTLGDITQADTEAIVNAANSRLAGGGGVDGAIHRAGGPEIMTECRKIGSRPTGEAVITTAGRLKAKKVIHTVGPVYRGRPEDSRLLANAYLNSLDRRPSAACAPWLSPACPQGPMAILLTWRPRWPWKRSGRVSRKISENSTRCVSCFSARTRLTPMPGR